MEKEGGGGTARLENVVDSGEQLRVDRETAVELISGLGGEAKCKLSLEHQDGAAEKGPVLEKLENERRGDLRGHEKKTCDMSASI